MSLPVAPDSNNALDLSSGSPSSPRMLHLAVRNGSIAIARALLVAGASVNARDDTGALPLHLAVQNRRRSVADLLLRHGADPNGLDEAGTTPLELAVRSQDEDMVRLLLSRGARVE
jgi:ankyrin repeat protein